MIVGIGWTVEFEGKQYTTLGYAASEDENGARLIEIAWNDYNASPTGYLAVPRKDLKIIHIPFKDVKPPGRY